jgi:cytochrome c biogenesis protein CcdA
MNGLLALAFGAGLLAPVNPCGFAVLPAVLAHTATDDPTSARLASRISSGLRAGAALTVGFASTFTVLGVATALGLRSLLHAIPWAAAVLGGLLTLIGLAMLAGRQIPIRLPTHHSSRMPQGPLDMLAYGVGYAIASASCSIAILLSVISQALATTNVSGLLVVFAAYAAGSATLLLTVALLAAFANTLVTRFVRPLLPHMTRIAGAVLVASGAYLLYYWLPQLSGHPATNALATAVGRLGGWITAHQLAITAGALAIIVTSVAIVALSRSRVSRSPSTKARIRS